MSDDAKSSRARVRDLVEQCLERADREGPAVVDAICREHPDVADAVRARLEQLRRTGLLEATGLGGGRMPERLGDFRLKRRLGGGGMGVVFLAEQESLRRDVALKVVRPADLFSPRARERFRREIDAIAALRHPAIVPIYCCGDEGDVPYYAMEFVDGANLDAVARALRGRRPEELRGADLAEFLAAARLAAEPLTHQGARPAAAIADTYFAATTWTDCCFRIVAELAAALAHAHERGVLHRDVKPSNVMLARDGRVVLVDFGLATTADAGDLTKTRAELGSLPYMPPEALAHGAGALSVRSDVYSLGIVLYELLTLAPAFPRENADELRRAIRAGACARPRALHPGLPSDAETVVLAAIDPDPARRYADAAAFRDDLRRFLRREPVHARRPGPLLRARRYCERHPVRVTALTLGLLALAAGGGTYAWQNQRRLGELQQINDQLSHSVTAERAANENSRRNAARARSAVMHFAERAASAELSDVPGAESAVLALLDDAVRTYEELLAEQDSPEVRAEFCEILRRTGWCCFERGDLERARPLLERAVALLPADDTEAARLPPMAREQRAAAMGQLAMFKQRTGDDAGAAELATRSASALAGLPDAETRRDMLTGRALSLMIRCEAKSVADADAEASGRTAVELVGRIAARPEANDDDRFDAARIRAQLAMELSRRGHPAAAMAEFTPALAVLEPLLASRARDGRAPRKWRDVVASVRIVHATTLEAVAQPVAAAMAWIGARRELEALARDFPQTPRYGDHLSQCLMHEIALLQELAEQDDPAPGRALCSDLLAGATARRREHPDELWNAQAQAIAALLAHEQPALRPDDIDADALAATMVEAASACLRTAPDDADYQALAERVVAAVGGAASGSRSPDATAQLAALQRLLHGAAAPVAVAAPHAPTFHGDVAPLLARHCVECHRDGGSAPFSLVDFADARGNAPMIREVTASHRMPPWNADPRFGRFANARGLTDAEIATLAAWVDAGAPEGERPPAGVAVSDPPAAEAALGPPDLVLTTPEIDVPAEGTRPYDYVRVAAGVAADRWIRAARLRNSAPQVVHHVLVFLEEDLAARRDARARGDKRPWRPFFDQSELLQGAAAGEQGRWAARFRDLIARDLRIGEAGGLNGYFLANLAGNGATIYAQDEGKLLPAGSTLHFQIHHAPNGKACRSTTALELWFRKEAPAKALDARGVATVVFTLPPGDANHEVVARYRLPRGAELRALRPHMHLRGKDMLYRAKYPDGSEEVLLSVPRFDFDWQHEYVLAEKKRLPKGTELEVVAHFDNSAGNPRNPDPAATVWFGLQTFEEMMIGYFEVAWDQDG